MKNIYKDIGKIQDIFGYNLITANDIGYDNYIDISNKLKDILILTEDILFEFENE